MYVSRSDHNICELDKVSIKLKVGVTRIHKRQKLFAEAFSEFYIHWKCVFSSILKEIYGH